MTKELVVLVVVVVVVAAPVASDDQLMHLRGPHLRGCIYRADSKQKR